MIKCTSLKILTFQKPFDCAFNGDVREHIWSKKFQSDLVIMQKTHILTQIRK